MSVGDEVVASARQRSEAEPRPRAPLPDPRSVRTGHRPDVEGMRAIAVGLVVAYHAGWSLFGGGFVGVDVFFVLSGFLITGLLADELQRSGSLSFLRFYGRRIRRLLPMSALVLISTAVAFSFVISPLDRPALTGDIRSAVFYVANWHFAGQALNYQTDPSSSPVLHFWSLGVEEQFYVVWPLLLILVAGRAARRNDPEAARRRMFVALAVLATASFVVSVVLTGRSGSAYYGLHTRAWELAAGGLLALGLPWVRQLPRAALALGGWIGLAVVVGSAVVMGASTPFPGSAAAVPVLGTVLLIAAGVGTTVEAGVSRLLSASWLTYVGRISYGWYLWHWPCLIFVRVLSGASITANDVGVTVHVWPGWTVLAVVVSFGLASVSHHVLENPVRRSSWLAAARGRPLALGAALMAAVVAVTAVLLPASASSGRPVVTALVSVAGQTAPVSSRVRLNLSPAAARKDSPTGLHGCYGSLTTTVAASNCVFGDKHGTKTIALIGDSHAEMWFPALQRASRAAHWRLLTWTKSECPFIDSTIHIAALPVYSACTTWHASVLAQLRAQPSLDAVIVAHSSGYLSLISGPDGTTSAPSSDAPTNWGNAWASTEKTLETLTKHVIVMRDAPLPLIDVPACLAAHGSDVRSCSFPRSEAFTDGNILLAAERANSNQDVSVVDLNPLLCPGNPCPVVWNDGTIMYRDTHHVSASMSRELGPALGAKVAHVLSP